MIEQAILDKVPAIVEAGTGTKSPLGYLAPVVLSGEKNDHIPPEPKTSTSFFKDVPLLSEAIGEEIDAMLMKGRKNYLCLHRYHQYFSQPSMLQPDHVQAKKSRSGSQKPILRTRETELAAGR